MDFDEDDTPVEESYLFNEEGNQLMADENELDVDAEGEEEREGEGGASDDGTDEPSSASDEEASDGSNDDEEDDDDLMDVDVSVVGKEVDSEATRRSSRLNGRIDYKDPSQPNHTPSLPPSLQRQRLFYPPPNAPIPQTNNLNPLISIPIASPVHALAASLCLSHVLTGSQDGYVRDWDTFASANGGRDGRPVLGVEGIRGGVCRGWWASNGWGGIPEPDKARKEPVYSLACQRDGLWGLSGIGNGSINLFTIRHAVGTTHHVLSGGHKSAVSSLALGESEDLLYSGGWDGALVEWDLNTGKQIRTFPIQPSQISSISLQPPPSRSTSSSTSSSDYNIFIRDLILPTPDSDPNGTRVSSVDPPDGTSDLTSIPSLTNGHHLTNGDAELEPTPVSSRRPSEMDAEGEDDDLTSADAEGEKDEDDAVVDSTQPSPTTNSPPAPHPEFPLPVSATNGHLPTGPPATADSTNPPPLPSTTDVSPPRPFYPSLSPASFESYSQDILLTSSIDGGLLLWDRRVPQASGSRGVGSLSSNATPWCMSACFSSNGTQVYAGRRNGTVEVWDVRRTSTSSSPNLFKTLRNPSDSGPVSSIVAFPDGKHIACASADAIRLWSTSFEELNDPTPRRHGLPPWKVVAGHSGGRVSSMIVDPLARFLITSSGNRGWGPQTESSSVVQFHTVESIF